MNLNPKKLHDAFLKNGFSDFTIEGDSKYMLKKGHSIVFINMEADPVLKNIEDARYWMERKGIAAETIDGIIDVLQSNPNLFV